MPAEALDIHVEVATVLGVRVHPPVPSVPISQCLETATKVEPRIEVSPLRSRDDSGGSPSLIDNSRGTTANCSLLSAPAHGVRGCSPLRDEHPLLLAARDGGVRHLHRVQHCCRRS
jgi:hypothetical protein